MTPRRQHEQLGRLIGRLVEAYAEVRGIEVLSCASTTFKRVDLDRAFEPDESYSSAYAAEIQPKDELALAGGGHEPIESSVGLATDSAAGM